MFIAALPPQAVGAIGSAQVLTDSASLVKELVDNALDAQATSITVEISTNALDVIQVKDNGHGVAPIDRPLVCKRHCTSKIKDLGDLARVGGASLGFRGEALASAVEISEGLVVTTRILGEATAVSFKVSQKGEVQNENRASQPVGTTIRITHFLKSLPVRRQTALKDSTKQLAKIKRTLQAYAFARPSVRLGLKVLKAKSDKGNWIYARKPDASVLDSAVKIIGKRTSDQCQWVVWDSNSTPTQKGSTLAEDIGSSMGLPSSYRIETLIPRPDSDLFSICNIGQYISIDSRPVSCTRGTLKQVVQLFKSYLRSSLDATVDKKVSDPFLCMNLVCPSGSYDANVEPAKDDVLFTDSPGVLELVESFFRSHYGELKSNGKSTPKHKRPNAEPRSFDLLLSKRPPATLEISVSATQPKSFPTSALEQILDAAKTSTGGSVRIDGNEEVQSCEADTVNTSLRTVGDGETPLESTQRVSNGTKQTWYHSMYRDDDGEELVNASLAAQSQSSEDEDNIRDVTVTNPWTLAKLNAPIQSQRMAGYSVRDTSSTQQLMTPAKAHDDLPQDLPSPLRMSRPDIIHGLPTPAKSQNARTGEQSSPDAFPYPMKAWGISQREVDTSLDRVSAEDQPSSSSVLDTWVQRPPTKCGGELFVPENDTIVSRPHRDFVSAATLPQGTPLNAIPDISQRSRQKAAPRKQQQRQSNINKSFTPPVHDPTRVWFDHLEPSSAHPPKSSEPRRQQDPQAADVPVRPTQDLESDPIIFTPPASMPPQHPGLALTMDYERRKAEAVAARRALLRQQQQQEQSHLTTTIPGSSPAIKISPSQQSQSFPLSPHQNRYRSALAALHTPQPASVATVAEEAEKSPSMDSKDPRSYLMRSLQSKDNRVKRTKSSSLPLETLSYNSDGEGAVRDWVQMIRVDVLTFQPQMGYLSDTEYNYTDHEAMFEHVEPGEAEAWERSIQEFIGDQYMETEEGAGVLEIDVAGALGLDFT